MTDEIESTHDKLHRFDHARKELTELVVAKEQALSAPIPGKRSQVVLSDSIQARIRLDALIDFIWPETGQGANDESKLARAQFEIYYLNRMLGIYDEADAQAHKAYESIASQVRKDTLMGRVRRGRGSADLPL